MTDVRRHSLSPPIGIRIGDEGGLKIAAEIWYPAALDPTRQVIAFVCLPGGSISRHYYALEAGDDTSFSFAYFMARRGMITITLDHLGIGESSKPADGFALTPTVMARANGNATASILADLRAGTLGPDLPALPNLTTIGVGHSMGAMLMAFQQARSRQHAALTLLGFSNRGLISHLPEPAQRLAGHPELIEGEISGIARAIYPDPYYRIPPSPEGSAIFAGSNAERAGVEALKAVRDVQLAVCGLQSMIPGGTRQALDAIDVPVFLGLGDADIAGPPHEIPASFPKSAEIDLLILPETGHCHFIFPSRQKLYSRLADWARRVLVAPH